MSKDPSDKILCAIFPHPDAPKGIVHRLETDSDREVFHMNIRDEVWECGKSVNITFRYYTRRYIDGLREFD